MKQYEAVIQAMRSAGGYATLGYLYQAALKIPDCNWGTKTPFASIRRIVQTRPEFFRIRPGLWALAFERKQILEQLGASDVVNSRAGIQFDHTYYQGLLVEIGNLRGFETAVPNQDKNRHFLHQKLSDITTTHEPYHFTYERIVRKAGTVDVVWFNRRQFPNALFEVEHSTNIEHSLVKFLDFQDFRLGLYVVADAARKTEFQHIVAGNAFGAIRKNIEFLDYGTVSELHTRLHASAVIEAKAGLP